MATGAKKISRLSQAMLATARDMRSIGLLDEAEYDKITVRHLGVKDRPDLCLLLNPRRPKKLL